MMSGTVEKKEKYEGLLIWINLLILWFQQMWSENVPINGDSYYRKQLLKKLWGWK